MLVTKDMTIFAMPIDNGIDVSLQIDPAKDYIKNNNLTKEDVKLVTTSENMICVVARREFLLG